MKMTLQQELMQIKKGNIAPVYLVVGTEQYLGDLFLETIKNQILEQEDDAMNFIKYDMEQTYLSVALEEANSMPFFGDRRVVQINHPYFLTGERSKSNLEHNVEELMTYINEPLESTVLVIFAFYEKLDSRKKVVKVLKKQAKVITIEPLKEHEIKEYVKNTIQESGYEITPEALESLLHLSQMNLSKIMGELDKLFLYTLSEKKITKPIVETLVPKSLEQNIFEMVEYVMKKNPAKALKLYQELILQGEETIKINAILLGHFRLMIQVKVMMNMGYQQNNMTDVLKIHPYRIKLAMQQVRNYDLKDLGLIYDELAENDLKIKTGKMEKDLLFELFILKQSALS